MGDGLKLTKDKRHRSSSSLAGVAIEGTRSERKLDIRASIPEVDDQFALAEARCDDLQEKIDLVKGLKRKRKMKKRSMTRLSESPAIQDVPFISVRAQPKKNTCYLSGCMNAAPPVVHSKPLGLPFTEVSHQAVRLRQLEMPQNPTRGYVDPARVEQHRMIGQVRASQMYREPNHERARNKQPVADPQQVKSRNRRDRADGDFMLGEASRSSHHQEVACEADENDCVDPINMNCDDHCQNKRTVDNKKSVNSRLQNNQKMSSKKPVGNMSQTEAAKWKDSLADTWRHTNPMPGPRRQQRTSKEPATNEMPYKLERASIVELFAKDKIPQKSEMQSRSDQRDDANFDKTNSRATEHLKTEDQPVNPVASSTSQNTKEKAMHRHPRRLKYRSRRYELPTVSSQMKQTGARYYCGSYNQSNIPFIVSKSTAPSHNIGVNIQQVLNGIKIQQPLSGIPFTIAHHMGLGHLPYNGKNTNNTPSLDHREMNVIRLGGRLVRLPSYKYMSYNRLLSLYRESDGMVSRFLRAMSRPHYLYNSMYNLATREDYDAATSKGHGVAHEAKQSLAEYASLYREYEQVEKHIKDGNYDPQLERRREELARELTAREDHIRKVMQEYRAGDGEPMTLRGSASTAGENYRHSTFKLNLGDAHL